jgi:hypothetical protein
MGFNCIVDEGRSKQVTWEIEDLDDAYAVDAARETRRRRKTKPVPAPDPPPFILLVAGRARW